MQSIKRTTCALLACMLVLLTGCNDYKITLWRPEIGVWYCDALEMQLSFDKSTPCYVVQEGRRIECEWSNDRGSIYVAVRYLWDSQQTHGDSTIFYGKYIDLTDDKYVLEEIDTGIQYTFYRIDVTKVGRGTVLLSPRKKLNNHH